jgi:AcrR family transcriptional regulator
VLCYSGGVPRPRIHDPDRVLDAAERLAAESGPAAVTIRAVASAVGISNGAIYHTFSSRADLLARAWLRAARRLLAVQTELMNAAGEVDPIDAVVASADAPAIFADRHPESSTLMWAVRRDELLGEDISSELAAELEAVQGELVELLVKLSKSMWDRKDAAAVDVITTCVVDLPTSILLRRNRIHQPTAREHLRAAVRAVAAIGPPERKHR